MDLLLNNVNMLTKKFLCGICLFISISAFSSSRYVLQGRSGLYGHDNMSMFSFGIGPTYLFGDIGGKQSGFLGRNDLILSSTRFDVMIAYRYLFADYFGVKGNLVYGNYYGEDVGTSLAERNYTFSSNSIELSVQGEYFVFGGPLSVRSTPHALYLSVGGGVVIHAAQVDGLFRRFDQINSGTLVSPVLPLSIGYEYYVGNGFLVGAQYNFRVFFTDFLDGISTSSSKYDDFTSSFNLVVSCFFLISSFLLLMI